jgi:hypothetical protein
MLFAQDRLHAVLLPAIDGLISISLPHHSQSFAMRALGFSVALGSPCALSLA